jgi:hypothetical protein
MPMLATALVSASSEIIIIVIIVAHDVIASTDELEFLKLCDLLRIEYREKIEKPLSLQQAKMGRFLTTR